jgi:hypothetical protein
LERGANIDRRKLTPAERHPLILLYGMCANKITGRNKQFAVLPFQTLPDALKEVSPMLLMGLCVNGVWSSKILEGVISASEQRRPSKFSASVVNNQLGQAIQFRFGPEAYFIAISELEDAMHELEKQFKSVFAPNFTGLSLEETWSFSHLEFGHFPPFLLHIAKNRMRFSSCVFGEEIMQEEITGPIHFSDCIFQKHSSFFFSFGQATFSRCSALKKANLVVRSPDIFVENCDFASSFNFVWNDGAQLSIHASDLLAITHGGSKVSSIKLSKCHLTNQLWLPLTIGERFRDVGPLRYSYVENMIIEDCYIENGFCLDHSKFPRGMILSGLRFSKHSSAPTAYDITVHESSDWGNVRDWPIYKGLKGQDAFQMINSYEYLRHEMNKKQKHSEEKQFYRLEMLCRLKSEPWSKRVPNYAFWVLSDYGLSVWRPLIWLLGLFAAFAGVFACILEKNVIQSVSTGFKLSASSVLGPFGMRREIFERDELAQFGGEIQFLMGLESIFGVILIFLIGLGIRNQFRMRL